MTLVSEIRSELRKGANPGRAKRQQRFHKEKLKSYGIMAPEVISIAKKYIPQTRSMTKQQLFMSCEQLLSSGYNEEATIAFYILLKLKKHDASDFKTLERWLKKYVDTWGKCDDYCTHILGHFIHEFPEFLPELNKWAKSQNRWLRRAAAVALIYSVRRNKNLGHAMKVSNILMRDTDDLVQKGYGWLLKEATHAYPKEVFDYVIRNKKQMPRTVLRYAIEKMPLKMKKEAMKK